MDKTSRAKIDLHHLPSFMGSVSMGAPGRRQPKTFDKGLHMPKLTELVCTNTSGEGNLGLEQATLGGVWDRNHLEDFFNPFSCVRFQVSSLSWEDVQRQISLWLGRKQGMDVVHIGS